MNRGWFAIPGVQAGDRTLDEQLLGLESMLSECNGRSVLDLGCAEGMIARHCLIRGAVRVAAVDNNLDFLRRAQVVVPCARTRYADLNSGLPAELAERYDIVLALAILHKLRDPEAALRLYAPLAGTLLVIRLPQGSSGVLRHKHGNAHVDSLRLMPELGFDLERDESGPRGERVHYWRRVA